MRKALFALAAVAALGVMAASPNEAQAQRWRNRGYYSYYYPGYYSGYYYPTYTSSYYYPYSSYYYYPGYSSYYYDPGYSTYYYSTPAYDYGYYNYYYPRRGWRGWRWRY